MSTPQRRAIVTGGSSGIGLAVCRRLLADGFLVATTSRSAARLEEAFPAAAVTAVTASAAAAASAATGGASARPLFIVADLATTAGCEEVAARCAEAWGAEAAIDLLVNNAGSGAIGQHLGKASIEAFDATFAINVRAPFVLTQLLLPRLQRGSVVVNVSSVAAQRPFAGMGPYCASKAAVDMLTQSAALELAPRGVRVVGVAPGTIETSFHSNAGMGDAVAASYYAASSGTHPLGRVGRPEEIADAVAWLASGAAGFVTGTTLIIDGGRLLTSSTAPQLSAAPSK